MAVNKYTRQDTIEEQRLAFQEEALQAGLAAVRRSLILLDDDEATIEQRMRLLCALIEAGARLAGACEGGYGCSFPVSRS